MSTFFQGSLTMLPFPVSIARDPTCNCYAIASTIGDPAVAWFDDTGKPVAGHAVIAGTPVAQVGMNPKGYNPFGIAFAPDGTLYFADIHLTCKGPLTDCGPASKAGRVMRVTFTNAQPNPPVAIGTGFDFPTSVTVCVPTRRTTCPG